MSISRRVAVGGLAALPFVQTKAQAQQNFPNRPMTMVVPFPAGGPADIFGRNLAERMSPFLGQPVLVENKSGAAGVTGVDFVAKAGDPHVMGLMSASAGAIMQSLMPKMPFDPAKDIAPQILVVRVQEVLAVSAKLGINDLKSFIAHAKANPNALRFSSAGNGTITQLSGELFADATGIKLEHVPYRGSAPAFTDLLAGRVQLQFDPVAIPAVKDGRVLGLATIAEQRNPDLPDLPTLAELGHADALAVPWYGIAAPSGTPREVVDRLAGAVAQALRQPAAATGMATMGMAPVIEQGEVFATRVTREREMYGALVRRIGMQPA